MPRIVVAELRHEAQPTKGSRFIATVRPVSNEDEAKRFRDELAAEWPDASHHCWAWRIASPAIDRAGDDGEPSGSAGRPILNQLSGRDLLDTAVIVSRWFGGTKLGVGGLVRAYGGAAGEALELATTSPWVERTAIEVVHGHGDTGVVERVLAMFDVSIDDVDWSSEVTRRGSAAAEDLDALWAALADSTNGRIRRD